MALFGNLFKGKSSNIPKGFNTVLVKEVNRLTEDAVQIVLDADSKTMPFIPGQYIDFLVYKDGVEFRRSYSICSGKDEPIAVAVKKVDGGNISIWFNEQVSAGTELLVSKPTGNFNLSDSDKNVVALAAGSGITPILAMAKAIENGERNLRLYYGNRSVNATLFKDIIDGLKNTDCTYFYSGEKIEGAGHGRIDKEALTTIIKSDLSILRADSYFLCGPEELILSSKEVLEMFGVSKDRIHYELFTTPVKAKQEMPASDENDFSGTAEVTLILDDDKEQFQLETNGLTILNKAKKEGIDVPYSCMGGVCSTCRAKVLVGKAKMDMNYALTDKEVEEGYILTCQSHPITEKIVVSYDE